MQIKSFIILVFVFMTYSITAQNLRKMKSIQTEIIINAPADKVWNILTDFSNYPNWNSFIISVEGELEQGGKLKNTMIIEGEKNVFKPTITKVETNKYFEWLGKLPLGIFKGRHYFELESISPNQTKLIHGEKFSGWLRGIIMKKIGEATRNNFIKMNKELKMLAEQTKK